MKNGWHTKRIGDLCKVISGQSPEGKFYNAERKGFPFYQGKKDFGEKFIKSPTTWTTQPTKIAKQGDILMSVRAPVGPVNFATDEVCIGRGLAAIRSGAELDRDFLFYQLLHSQADIAGKQGAVFASINKSEIEDLPLAFAPLPEQQRIVGILDKAFQAIATAKANAEKNLAYSRLLFVRLLNNVLSQPAESWSRITFGDVVTRSRGGINIKSTDYCAEGIPVLTKGDVKPFGLISHGGKYVPLIKAQTSTWPCAKPGDLIVTTRDLKPSAPFLGLVAQIPVDRKYVVSQGATFFALNDKYVTPEFFVYWCCSDRYREHVRSKKVGSTQVHIRQEDLFAAPLWLPPISDQRAIVKLLDDAASETNRLASVYQRRLTALEALKKSLLHQAFTGQL